MLSACFFLPVASFGRQLSATTTFAWKKNIWGIIIIGPSCDKTCFGGFANNKGAEQPVHSRSLISALVIHLLESII